MLLCLVPHFSSCVDVLFSLVLEGRAGDLTISVPTQVGYVWAGWNVAVDRAVLHPAPSVLVLWNCQDQGGGSRKTTGSPVQKSPLLLGAARAAFPDRYCVSSGVFHGGRVLLCILAKALQIVGFGIPVVSLRRTKYLTLQRTLIAYLEPALVNPCDLCLGDVFCLRMSWSPGWSTGKLSEWLVLLSTPSTCVVFL